MLMETLPEKSPRNPDDPVCKVLLVDDEAMLLECTAEILTVMGFTVITARDGQEALDEYRAHHGDLALVIMDINMPHMDGIEASKNIREIDPSAKVILSSGYTKEAPGNAVANAFLAKPYRGIDLWQVIRRLLRPSS
jgi:CheY-like chemotaxis protein